MYICGYVKKKERLTFDNLGKVYNVTTADGAEQAYRKSMENLARQMFKNEKLHAISVKQKNKFENKKKIAAALYEYQVDYGGDWDI